MHPKLDLFEEFEGITREEWTTDVKRYLKGKPLESLTWNIGATIAIDPYPTASMVEPLALPAVTNQNDWKIVERIVVEDIARANKAALHALNWGAECLQFEFLTVPSVGELQQLFNNIKLSIIDLVCLGQAIQKEGIQFLQNLHKATQGQTLRGAVELGAKESLECILFVKDYMPNVSVVELSLHQEGDLVENIANLLGQVANCFDLLLARGLSIDRLSSFFRLKVSIDNNYFVELSKLRAIKRLWLGLLEAYGATKAAYPHIAAFTQSAATDNPYQNMITATTQTMAAAIGGADSILVTPSTNWKEQDDFALRIARNVQHLLKLESYLNRVVDPARGAYYIENISQQLTKKAWTQFQNLT